MEKEWRVKGWIGIQPGAPLAGVELSVDGHEVRVYYEVEDSRVRIKQIHAIDLNTDLVRSVNLGAVSQAIYSMLREHPERLELAALIEKQIEDGVPWQVTAEEKMSLEAARQRVRERVAYLKPPLRGRSAANDTFYREIADAYLDFYTIHGQRVIVAMTESLRIRLGRPGLSAETVRSWVKRAKENGWLTRSGTRGKAGAEPGWRLKDWRAEKETES